MDSKHLCPPGETLWTTYYKHGVPRYIVTSKTGNREVYFLYPIINGERGKRIGKARSPIALEDTYLNEFYENTI
ncbi:MAG: hypothetical protein IJW77_01705 [Clostridia bacterium]|nr:hypothetical protein [Clostridia bacterium]